MLQDVAPPRGEKPGAIAQLGERLHGMQEVDGSIPSSSTNRQVQGLATPALNRSVLSADQARRFVSPSSSGLGHRPFTAVTGVRVP
ncbi:protein of unknown function [Pseudomonas mediterranea]